jgi:hypothetical protein
VPGQSLALMNDPFVQHQAKLLGRRAEELPAKDDSQRITRMYELAFARPPTAMERSRSLALLSKAGGGAEAWSELAHAMFQMKEFIYLR